MKKLTEFLNQQISNELGIVLFSLLIVLGAIIITLNNSIRKEKLKDKLFEVSKKSLEMGIKKDSLNFK